MSQTALIDSEVRQFLLASLHERAEGLTEPQRALLNRCIKPGTTFDQQTDDKLRSLIALCDRTPKADHV